jgi:hypothetical protein
MRQSREISGNEAARNRLWFFREIGGLEEWEGLTKQFAFGNDPRPPVLQAQLRVRPETNELQR